MPETEVTREQLLASVHVLEPGDLLVIRVLTTASADKLADIAERVRMLVPDGVRCLVLPKDVDVEAHRAGVDA